MSAQVVFVRVHEPDQVKEILAEAVAIAGDHDVGTPEWNSVFNKAVDLLSERVTLQPMALNNGVPLVLPGLRG